MMSSEPRSLSWQTQASCMTSATAGSRRTRCGCLWTTSAQEMRWRHVRLHQLSSTCRFPRLFRQGRNSRCSAPTERSRSRRPRTASLARGVGVVQTSSQAGVQNPGATESSARRQRDLYAGGRRRSVGAGATRHAARRDVRSDAAGAHGEGARGRHTGHPPHLPSARLWTTRGDEGMDSLRGPRRRGSRQVLRRSDTQAGTAVPTDPSMGLTPIGPLAGRMAVGAGVAMHMAQTCRDTL
mmetsp:Transcript_146749/g.471005  ORF Transcript_146749/g.471005 Transcript_146749/m.471005 type:complete len:239 (-) Transcript_146749:10-726(-)